MLLLVAGAIVNVAVAWGLCMRPIPPFSSTEGIAQADDLEPFRKAGWTPFGVKWEGYSLRVGKGYAPGITEIHCLELVGFRPLPANVGFSSRTNLIVPIGTSLQSGLPMRSLGGVFVERHTKSNATLSRERSVGLLNVFDARLPTAAIWPGFAINTVFYAVVLWLLFAAPFALRRRRRIKRGLCPKCAYPRGAGTNQVCTECGAAVPRVPSTKQWVQDHD